MADESTASVIPLHQGAPKKARKRAETAKAPRPRSKKPPAAKNVAPPPSADDLIPLEFRSADANGAAPPVPATTSEAVSDVTAEVPPHASPVTTSAAAPRRSIASYVLVAAALSLAAVGIVING